MKLSKYDIRQISEYLSKKPVIKAYLFGSYVREEANYNSDVDILVELDYSKKIGLGFIQMKIDLQDILEKKVDLVTSQSVSKYIQPVIDKEKQLIYAR